jgi:cytosine/adenosine deaminase-related metal-dependent hydrolase
MVASAGPEHLLSIHHQENTDENLFFKNGSGAGAARRIMFNPDLPPYHGSGKRPMESIAGYFAPEQKILLVHNTVSEQQDIEFVETYFRHAYWCLCPNANLYIENRLPDISLFRAASCHITLGTDSLASNHQLSILEEIKTIQKYFHFRTTLKAPASRQMHQLYTSIRPIMRQVLKHSLDGIGIHCIFS